MPSDDTNAIFEMIARPFTSPKRERPVSLDELREHPDIKKFGLPANYWKKAARAGEIPCHRIGNVYIFSVEAVLHHLLHEAHSPLELKASDAGTDDEGEADADGNGTDEQGEDPTEDSDYGEDEDDDEEATEDEGEDDLPDDPGLGAELPPVSAPGTAAQQ